MLKLKAATLRKEGKERVLGIEESSAAGSALVIRFTGYDSPESVKELQGMELLVNRENAAPLKPGEFYVEDIKGLEAVAENGEILGNIAGIIEGGGGDLAEIRLKNGQSKIIPF